MLLGSFALELCRRGFLRSVENLKRGALPVAVVVASEWSRCSYAPLKYSMQWMTPGQLGNRAQGPLVLCVDGSLHFLNPIIFIDLGMPI